MRSVGVGLVVLGIACRAPDAPRPAVPEARAAQERVEPVEPEPVEPEPVVLADSKEPVEPLPTWTPIELPFPSQALVLRPLRDIPPLVLFPDEANAIRRGIARALAARRHALVPIDELERIEAAAARGQLVLEDDLHCRAPLLPEELVARYFAERPFVEIEAGCIDGCRIHASIQDPADPDAYQGFASRRVARVHDPRAWIAVAGDLREDQGWGGIGFGLIGMSHPPPIRFDFPQGVGPWRRPVEELSFLEAERLAAACAHPDPLVGLTHEVRAAVGRRGELVRCETSAEHSMARATDGACICGALEALPVPAGPAGRRLRVQAVDDGIFRGSGARFELVQSRTEPWLRRLDESPALDRCLRVATLARGLQGTITLALEPDGTVSDARLDGEITTQPEIRFAACMVSELRSIPLPCRPPGIDRLAVRLSIEPP